MKYFLIFADCYPAPARHGIRELRDRIILREFDEIHSIHFIEFTLWRTMSGVRSLGHGSKVPKGPRLGVAQSP